ncbi:MAG: hypothetical protein HOC71_17845 [Candidatus Latescibacteria bacterium]|nr:hypothetical protein [Candidatus Latescibacterota bacterium]
MNKNDKVLIQNLSTAILTTFCLNNLFKIRYFFPDVIEPKEVRKLNDDLIMYLESSLKFPGFKHLKEYYEQNFHPDFDNLKVYSDYNALFYRFLLLHPLVKLSENEDKTFQSMGETIGKCIETASPPIREILSCLNEIMLFDCRIPSPADDPSFQEPKRFFYILINYWEICKKLILKELDLSFGFSPHPLFKLIVNIRSRIEICLSKLSDINELTEAKENILHLLDALLSSEMHQDMLDVPEYSIDLIEKVDLSIEQTRLKLGSKAYPLTSIEESFINIMKDAKNNYQEKSEIAWKGMLEDVKQLPELKFRTLKIEFPDKYEDIVQMIKDSETPEVIRAVVSNKKTDNYIQKSSTRSTKDLSEVILCLQELPSNRKYKNFYAEIVVNPGKGEEEKPCRLGKTMLRFFWLTFYIKSQGNNWVEEDTIKKELEYDNSKDPYWFSKRFNYCKNWLEKKNILNYFEFHDHQVRTTLSKDQISLNIPDYEKAKSETKA